MSATDELRAMAESIGLVMPQAATLMMEAADTICELRNRCNNLVDERERLFRANVEKNGEILRLVKENARLRELVARVERARRDLCDAYPDAELLDCEECPAWSECRGDLMDRMRELGIEVDE